MPVQLKKGDKQYDFCQRPVRARRLGSVLLAVFVVFIGGCSGEPPPDESLKSMVLVPAGEFTMGSDEKDTEGLAREFGDPVGVYFVDEGPIRDVYVEGFYIDLFEVTNSRYREFVVDSGHLPPPHWLVDFAVAVKGDEPVMSVTWFDAALYCLWAGKRLPTETEWEKAARGTDGRRYPWGEEYDEKKGNFGTSKLEPVGSYSEDKSPYGVFDMGGNVMEWTDTWYAPYPGGIVTEELKVNKNKVIRGGTAGTPGHYTMNNLYARTTFRRSAAPKVLGVDTGFRCAVEEKKK